MTDYPSCFNVYDTISAMMLRENIEKFMRDSNAIEGEFDDPGRGKLYSTDFQAAMHFLRSAANERAVLLLHAVLATPKIDVGTMKTLWAGFYRPFDVVVGEYTPPGYKDVPKLMKTYFKQLPGMNAWQAHNHFEKIHPFADLNGRVGRLIWLWKAIHEERFKFGLSFLQAYYYSTLSNFEKVNAEPKAKFRKQTAEVEKKRCAEDGGKAFKRSTEEEKQTG